MDDVPGGTHHVAVRAPQPDRRHACRSQYLLAAEGLRGTDILRPYPHAVARDGRLFQHWREGRQGVGGDEEPRDDPSATGSGVSRLMDVLLPIIYMVLAEGALPDGTEGEAATQARGLSAEPL